MIKQLLLLLMTLLPLQANANGIPIEGIYYDLNQEEKTAMVTFRDFNEGNTDAYTGTLNIPSTITYNGDEYSVTSIGKEAFNYCYNLLSITIPSSIIYIAGGAFDKTGWYKNQPDGIVYLGDWVINYKGEKLTGSLTIIDGTRGIAELAFESCGSMTNITIPNSVKYIGARAFEGCSNLTSVTIPDGVTSIKGGTFLGCSSLTTITLPNSVTSIESTCAIAPWTYGAFKNCSSLISITLGENLETIGNEAFYGCSSLVSASIPDKVTSIESYAFYKCSNLVTVTIPSSVTSIGHYAFGGCNSLASVHISDIEAWCKISFDFGEDNNPLSFAHHLYLRNDEIKDLVIPNSVTSIGYNTFNGCSGLTSITIPNSVTGIGRCAFKLCSGLTTITIPNSVTSIGESAFSGCCGLTAITIPNSVTSIGNSAFTWCTSLTSITIPNSVTSIGESAFLGCRQAKNIILPESLQIIRKLTFSNCSSLTDITIPAAVEYIYQEAFFGCSSLTEIKALPTAPPFAYGNTFSNYNATLKVPEAGKDVYAAHDVWSKFEKIQTLTGEDVNPEKCATPTIKYIGGKLLFECETEGVEFVYSITTPANTTNQTGNNVDMPHTNTVSVYAKKAGYMNSDVATEDIDVRGMKGDVNTDGEVNVGDIVTVTNIMAGKDN